MLMRLRQLRAPARQHGQDGDGLLRACNLLRVVATSREGLAIPGETVRPCRPCPFPISRPPPRTSCPSTRPSASSSSGPSPRYPTSESLTATPQPSHRSAGAWTGSRSRSSSPLQGSVPCRWSRSPRGSMTASACSPARAGSPFRGTRRCARPSIGAMTCSPRTSEGSSGASASSSAARRWKPPRRCAPVLRSRSSRSSISCRASSTSPSWSRTRRAMRRAIGSWRRFASTRATSSSNRARRATPSCASATGT